MNESTESHTFVLYRVSRHIMRTLKTIHLCDICTLSELLSMCMECAELRTCGSHPFDQELQTERLSVAEMATNTQVQWCFAYSLHMPPGQTPVHSLRSIWQQWVSLQTKGCGKATLRELSKLHKVKITRNLKRPKSGHSRMSGDKHSANASEPRTTPSRKTTKLTKTHEQDFWEFRSFYFDNVVWVLVWRGSTERAVHATPTWSGSPDITHVQHQHTLIWQGGRRRIRYVTNSNVRRIFIIATLRLGTKKHYEGRPISCLHCCS